MFTRKDLLFSVITGFYAGLIIWQIMIFLGRPDFWGISFVWLIVVVPVLWILGVNLGYFLGQWMPFFNQFGRYAAIGFTNAAVDFGVLNLLIASSGIASGWFFTVFKGISFIGATLHSYFWNKYWAFEFGQSGQGKQEFIKFFGVTAVAILINVAVASFLVNGLDPLLGLDENTWANVGAVAGSAVALIFSFAGFRLIVFKKTKPMPIFK